MPAAAAQIVAVVPLLAAGAPVIAVVPLELLLVRPAFASLVLILIGERRQAHQASGGERNGNTRFVNHVYLRASDNTNTARKGCAGVAFGNYLYAGTAIAAAQAAVLARLIVMRGSRGLNESSI
jgi:hypothetical protein